jgi:tRNA uridine 5-carboxymethylaminomethyl modification enzyme
MNFKKIKLEPSEANPWLIKLGTSPISEKTTLATLLKRPQVSISDIYKLAEH